MFFCSYFFFNFIIQYLVDLDLDFIIIIFCFAFYEVARPYYSGYEFDELN